MRRRSETNGRFEAAWDVEGRMVYSRTHTVALGRRGQRAYALAAGSTT